jgi:hypothetical protein
MPRNADPRNAERPMVIGRSIATGATGLEPATSGVTGRRSNQLSYAPLARGPRIAPAGGVASASGRRRTYVWPVWAQGTEGAMYIGLGTLLIIVILLAIFVF